MLNYRELLDTGADAPDATVIGQDLGAVENWEEAYIIGKYLYESASGETDRYIIDAYEKSFELGLSIRVNKECFLIAIQQLARVYFQFRKYDEAISKLMVFDSNVDATPDWINLDFVAAQIQTENVLYWAEAPQLLFNRIDAIEEDNPESVQRRRFLFLEFLNRISELSETHDVSQVDLKTILEKAEQLGVDDSRECLDFQTALGFTVELPEVFSELVEIDEPDLVIDETFEDDKDIIIRLQEELNRRQEEIKRLNDIIDELKAQNSTTAGSEKRNDTSAEETAEIWEKCDLFDVDRFLSRRQRILIIGGSEVKEDHLRGRLKRMGFGFSKDQLEFLLDYDDVKDYSSRIKPWTGKYAGIIVGPCPHKAKNIGDYSSFLEMLRTEEGYPHIEEARDQSGTLKISTTSIGEAMIRMAVYLQTIV